MIIDGRSLETAWHGPPPEVAPTLVFLHEGLGSVSTWRAFPAEVAEATGCGALVYSRVGYGLSEAVPLPRPLSYMHDEAERLPAILDAFQVRRAILFGHSDGGSIALLHAADETSAPRLLGLVLEAPHVFVEPISVTSIAEAREAFVHGDLRERLRRHHHGNVDCAFLGWNGAWLDPGFLTWNLESKLPEVHVPTLVIQGEDDAYGTLAQVESIARGVGAKVERCILPACGHSPHRDKPMETLAATAGFVRRLLSTE